MYSAFKNFYRKIEKSTSVSQMEVKIAWVPAVQTETAHGQSGGLGSRVHGRVEWVSSRGCARSSAQGPMALGARTYWKETRSIASATSGLAEVALCKSSQMTDQCISWLCPYWCVCVCLCCSRWRLVPLESLVPLWQALWRRALHPDPLLLQSSAQEWWKEMWRREESGQALQHQTLRWVRQSSFTQACCVSRSLNRTLAGINSR